MEREPPEVANIVGNGQADKAGTTGKGKILDIGNAVGNPVIAGYACRALHEHRPVFVKQDAAYTAKEGIESIDIDGREESTFGESTRVDIGDSSGNGDVGKSLDARE